LAANLLYRCACVRVRSSAARCMQSRSSTAVAGSHTTAAHTTPLPCGVPAGQPSSTTPAAWWSSHSCCSTIP
jgi:hypothetical protein